MNKFGFVILAFLLLPSLASADICSRNLLIVNATTKILEKTCDQIAETELSSIKELYLDYHNIDENYTQSVGANDLKGFSKLELLELVLEGKKYSYEVPNDLLIYIPQIKKLGIASKGFPPSPEFFKNLTNLEEFWLNTFGTQGLKEILVLLPHLKSLNLLNLTVGYTEGYKLFSNSSKLEKLEIHSDEMPYMPNDFFDGLENLKKLSLYLYDPFHHGGFLNKNLFSKLTKLETLNLSMNTATSIDAQLFSQNTKLKDLRIEAQNIRELPAEIFSTLTQLETLVITGWWNLLELPSDLLVNQKQLQTLSAYRILGRDNKELSRNFLKGLTQLKKINFSNNSLKELPVEIFEDVSEKSEIDLGWGNDLPIATRRALRVKYPNMKFSFN